MSVELTADIMGKFCNLGRVTSFHWSKVYVVIEHRTCKIYLNEDDSRHRPDETLFEAPLDSNFRASPWKRKQYELMPGDKADFYCFYVEHDGIIGQRKLFKIGTPDIELAEKIMRCIEVNTRNRTKSF
jgi:hypothetical protein